jgi:hypothetical protein
MSLMEGFENLAMEFAKEGMLVPKYMFVDTNTFYRISDKLNHLTAYKTTFCARIKIHTTNGVIELVHPGQFKKED